MKNKHAEENKPAENSSQQQAAEEAGVSTETTQENGIKLSVEEYQSLLSALEEARQKSCEYFDGWQRERADFSNYKRRIERDQASLSLFIAGEIVRKYLVVSDDLERSMKSRPINGEGAAWADGIELIFRKMQSILEGEGVKRMDAENESFDPSRHEAISYEEHPQKQSGEIIEVLQPGYLLGERVLRPARVRVAR